MKKVKTIISNGMDEKIIKISHKDKPEACAGKKPIISLLDTMEMLNDRATGEWNEASGLFPKIKDAMKLDNSKVGCINVYGTAGEMDCNQDFEKIFNEEPETTL